MWCGARLRRACPRLVATLLLLLACVAVSEPAHALGKWRHAAADRCTACHVEQGKAVSNAACTACHSGFTTVKTQTCWSCHAPGQDMGPSQTDGGCSAVCHLYEARGHAYAVAYSHGSLPHTGAASAACRECHGVCASGDDPGTSQHHDAVDSAAPSCRRCHDGKLASLKVNHDGVTSCTSCHTGTDRPPLPSTCLGCHSSTAHSEAAQISFATNVSCTDARCHGTAVVHNETPRLTRNCADCHAPHYRALGTCTSCHTAGSAYHHGTAAPIPLAECGACHDGGIASAFEGHAGAPCASCHTGMATPAGVTCTTCHSASQFGAATCTAAGCHPIGALHSSDLQPGACADCHTPHYQALGGCASCHTDVPGNHHRGVEAAPLAGCATCHDGGIASARQGHVGVACSLCHTGMSSAAQPASCNQCHRASQFGAAVCTACHSPSGLTGREQVHTRTPSNGMACANCHDGHNQDAGACATCHDRFPETHHGVVARAASSLQFGAGAAVVKAGAGTQLTGVLRDAAGEALAGRALEIQARRGAERPFAVLTTVTTGADGSFTLPARPLALTVYRAIWRGEAQGTTQLSPAITSAVVAVRQSLRLTARARRVKAGAAVRLRGKVAPTALQLGASRGALVTLRIERRSGSRWVKVTQKRVRAAAAGSFAASWRARRAGRYRLRASVTATDGLLAGRSAWVSVTCRR